MWIRTILISVVTVLFILQNRPIEAQSPVDQTQIKPCPDSPRSPFRYVITRNRVNEFRYYQNGPNVKARGVSVLLDRKSFTEENLKQLFSLLSKRFPEPTELVVSVYTNLADVPTPEEDEIIGVNCTIDIARLTPEHPWAFYMRSSESERFTYHSKKPDEPPKQVVLRGGL
jgi:hypothetical protein